MAHHAYFAAGERTAAVAAARAFAEQSLGFSEASVDIVYLSFELFSVDDARRLIDAANIGGLGGTKAIIVSLTRIFHEAQNALLKMCEEPPEGTTIILCVPSEGIFIPTLRSRLLPLPQWSLSATEPQKGIAGQFLHASGAEREKLVSKLLEQAKSDKEEAKQQARRQAIELFQGLTEAAHARLHGAPTESSRREAQLFLEDLASFTPMLYERSAPLKMIFEHLSLVLPKGLS